jgi:hypothetical protein
VEQMLVHKKYENVIKDYKVITERIILVLVWTNNTTLNIFAIYSPEDCKPMEEKENFLYNFR